MGINGPAGQKSIDKNQRSVVNKMGVLFPQKKFATKGEITMSGPTFPRKR